MNALTTNQIENLKQGDRLRVTKSKRLIGVNGMGGEFVGMNGELLTVHLDNCCIVSIKASELRISTN